MDKVRILIVEDEAIIAMGIESNLQSLGYEVTSIVNTGEKAIQNAEKDKPDLILMDIRIKGEMDGIDTAEVIRNNFGIPVIFSTAYLDQERIDRAKITMPFGYVLKPIQERDLKVTLEMALYVAKVDAKRRKTEGELDQKAVELETINENLRTHQIELEQQNDELRASQIALTELQSQYFDLYEFAPMGYLTLNKKGIITKANLTATAMLGLERSRLKNLGFSNFIDEHSQDTFYHHKKLILEAKTQQTCELLLVKKDKTKFWAQIECKALFDKKGEFVQLNTNILDITKRKQSEKAHNKVEKHLADIIDSVSHPFHVIDVKTRIIKHASKETGHSAIGKTCFSASYDSPVPCNTVEHSCPIDIILKTKKPTVIKHVHSQTDGTKRLVEIHASPLFDENGEVEFIVESNIDITDRKET